MAASLSEVQKCVRLSSAGATTMTSASSMPSPSAERSASLDTGSETRARIFLPTALPILELRDAAHTPFRRRVTAHRVRSRAAKAVKQGVEDDGAERDGQDYPHDDEDAAGAVGVVPA